LLKEVDPTIARLAVLWNPTNTAFQRLQLAEAQAAAGASGIELSLFEVSTPDQLEPTFSSIHREGTRALLVLANPFFALRRDQLGNLAIREGLMTICGSRDFSEGGCLLSSIPIGRSWSRRLIAT
jgi:putative tryptophan/tyrosine transport system substrate-binding protein